MSNFNSFWEKGALERGFTGEGAVNVLRCKRWKHLNILTIIRSENNASFIYNRIPLSFSVLCGMNYGRKLAPGHQQLLVSWSFSTNKNREGCN